MISVIISTFGDIDIWGPLADRARKSVGDDTEVIMSHAYSLCEARNQGARLAQGDRLVFLDADDELEPGFCDKIVEPEDVLQPMTIYRGGEWDGEVPFWIPPHEDLIYCNYIIVGAPVSKLQFLEVGGFDDYKIAEDWALWLKLKKYGASFGRTKATYIVNVNLNGRNSPIDIDGELDRIRRDFS